MAYTPNVDNGPVHMGDFPLEAYQQYEDNQAVSSLSNASGSEVAFRSTIASETALLDEFAKLSSRYSRVTTTFVDRPHDLALSALFLPHAVSKSFIAARAMSEQLETFLASSNGKAAAKSGETLREFLDQIVELNHLCEVIHTQMSRIGKG